MKDFGLPGGARVPGAPLRSANAYVHRWSPKSKDFGDKLKFVVFCKGCIIFNARQRSCGKVIFSVVSVGLFTDGEGPHVAITHDKLDLTVQGPPNMELHYTGNPWTWTLLYVDPRPLASDIWWPRLET